MGRLIILFLLILYWNNGIWYLKKVYNHDMGASWFDVVVMITTAVVSVVLGLIFLGWFIEHPWIIINQHFAETVEWFKVNW